MAAAGVSTLAFAFLLPENHGAHTPSSDWREAPKLLASGSFLLMILAAGLTQGSHAVYYAFSILRWSELGYAPDLIGWLWATGVIAEIFLLTRVRGLAKHFSPAVMIGIGGLGAALALDPDCI